MRMRLNSGILLTLFFLLMGAGCVTAGPFTLERVLAAPFVSHLTAATRSGKIAWVTNTRGARNIWMAEPPAYKPVQLTDNTQDDGLDLGELAWSPDGGSLAYVKGGDFEMRREYPNPRSIPEGADQSVWIVSRGAKPRRIAEGRAPAFSPKGDRLAFVNHFQVWTVLLGKDSVPVQMIRSRGDADFLRWSPDGAKLAFVSLRENHSFVAVYDMGSGGLRFLDPSVDLDSSPVWSPDGKEIAFIRVPTDSTNSAFAPKRTAQPWSIRMADPITGKGREAWRAMEGAGSAFHAITAQSQLFWAADGRLVFPWEADGWLHLYSVPASGGKPILLTPGQFEVEQVSLTPDRKELVYSSNQDDIDRRHVWRVAVTGDAPVAVTSGDGLEWSPAMTSDGRSVAFFRSDARRPGHLAIRTGKAEPRDLSSSSIPADFAFESLVAPQPVVFPTSDGWKIHGQLFLPPQSADKRHPAVLFFHGGPRRQMLLGWHYMDYYNNAYGMNQFLASKGYVVLSVNFRGGIGYGLDFREAPNCGGAGGSEFYDVLGAAQYLKSRPDVDPSRIGLWGGSYGGYLTAMGLAKASDVFAAGVDFHGVHDWNIVTRNFVPWYDPEKHADEAKLAFESSPMAHVKTWRSPVLLVHGDDDRNVPFSETRTLVEALRKQGVEFEHLVFPDEVHDFLLHESWLQALRAGAGFLDRRLANKASAESTTALSR